MRAYPRLTEGQRNQIYALKKAGFTQCAIAEQIGVHKSTISRELSATQVCAAIDQNKRIGWLKLVNRVFRVVV